MSRTPAMSSDPPSSLAPDGNFTFSLGPASGFRDLAETWRALETRADISFFLTWDWMGRWLAEIEGPTYVLACRQGGRIVALALLRRVAYRRHRVLPVAALLLHQVGDHGIDIITVEYNGFLADRAVADAVTHAGLAFLQRPEAEAALGGRWDEMHFGGVTGDFETLVGDTGLMPWLISRKPSWAVDLDAVRQSGRSYLDMIGTSTRYQIRRSLRLYEKRGPLTARRATTQDEIDQFYREMQDLHQRYWISRGAPGSYAYPFYERFHHALLRDCVPKGTVELVRVAAGPSVIGYVYNFICRGWVCAYHTGFAYETDPKLKPGLVSHYLCIEQHLREGARLYDFMAGDNRYKANLGTPGPELLHLVLQRPVAKLRAEQALRRLKTAVSARRAGTAAQSED